MAMRDEASPIIDKLNLIDNGQINNAYPIKIFSGSYKDININLLINGECSRYLVDNIGTQPSAITTHMGIEKFSPNLIINAGTAGGFKSDKAKIGDVYLGYPHVCFHDRRINLPKYKEYGIGFYPCYPCEKIARELNLRLGVISTGNSLEYTEKDLEIMREYNGVVKDMEAASIAWVAEQFKVPFLAIKAITDIVDGEKPTEEEFLQNIHSASQTLCYETIRVLDYVSMNSI